MIEVVSRNLSCSGLSFLNNGYLHVGTRCELQLITSENAWVDIRATVARCRLIAGRVHEVGLRFDQSVDDSLFVSQTLAARILVVDDAEDQLALLSHFLKKAGAEVITANRGVRALKLVAEEDFDLVLLDVEMPGISGPQVAQTLRDRGVTLPIIAFTARDDSAAREECLAAGCSDVLIKPVGRTCLIDAVARYLAVDAPIRSKYADDPDMTEFISDFVDKLAARVQEMESCLQSREVQDLAVLARQVRVVASDDGGCGYGEVSAAAQVLVKALTSPPDWTAIEAVFETLRSVAGRVKK